MEKSNRYEIFTIKELKDLVTEENADSLGEDLKLWLKFIAGVKTEMPKLDAKVELSPSFIWIDDNKHDATVSFTMRKK